MYRQSGWSDVPTLHPLSVQPGVRIRTVGLIKGEGQIGDEGWVLMRLIYVFHQGQESPRVLASLPETDLTQRINA